MSPRTTAKVAPWNASDAASFGTEVSRSSASGGSWSSISPQTPSNTFLPIRPAIRPLTMLSGMKRIFAICVQATRAAPSEPVRRRRMGGAGFEPATPRV